MFKPSIFVFLMAFLLALTVDISEAKRKGGKRRPGRRPGGPSGGYYGGGFDLIFLYVILGILGFCFLLWVLYQCCELAEDNDYQENNTYRSERNIQPKYELNPTAVNNSNLMAQPNNVYSQNKRQENNFNSGFNPAFNPTFNPAAIKMPPNPEYEARNNFH